MHTPDTNFYKTNWKAISTRTTDPNIWLTIYFDVSPDIEVVQHSVYSFFDLLRDLGGISAMMIFLGSFANSFFSYKKLENMLVARLYKKPKVSQGVHKNESKAMDD